MAAFQTLPCNIPTLKIKHIFPQQSTERGVYFFSERGVKLVTYKAIFGNVYSSEHFCSLILLEIMYLLIIM